MPLPISQKALRLDNLYCGPTLLNCTQDIRRLAVKHEKEGVMRRNKLLLEQILHERLGDIVHINMDK